MNSYVSTAGRDNCYVPLGDNMDIGFRIVSTPAPNENWRHVWFSPIESSAASDSTNPDHDGLTNLLERAFHLNPNQPALPILSKFFKSS